MRVKSFFLFFLILTLGASLSTYAAPIIPDFNHQSFECSDFFNEDQTIFLNSLEKRTLELATAEGDSLKVVISKNKFDFYNAELVFNRNGEISKESYPIFPCMAHANGKFIDRTYFTIYGDLKSPIGTYRYPLIILLPMEQSIFRGPLFSAADFRVNKWKLVRLKLD